MDCALTTLCLFSALLVTARQARALAGPVGITPAVGSKDFGPAAVEVLGPREAAPSRPGPSPATSW